MLRMWAAATGVWQSFSGSISDPRATFRLTPITRKAYLDDCNMYGFSLSFVDLIPA